jgi:hypothetical protein
MPGAPGKVYVRGESAHGVFLDASFLASLHAYIDNEIGDSDAVGHAGATLDSATLRQLAAATDDAAEPVTETTPPEVLSAAAANYLELLLRQPLIRQGVPFRLQATCRVCRQTRVIDPVRRERRRKEQGQGEVSKSSLAGIWSALSEHHPLQAALRIQGEIDRLNHVQGESVVCNRCDGDEFGFRRVTFCPQCGKLRAETILQRCPDCHFDYQALAVGDIWEPADTAIARFRVAVKQQTIIEQDRLIYPGVTDTQLAGLLELAPDERLIGLCHCAAAPDTRPLVILLLTTARLAWSRETPVVGKLIGPKAVSFAWGDVALVESPAGRPGSVDFQFGDGQRVSFNLFQGAGADLSGHGVVFDSDGVGRAARGMLRRSRRVG